MAASQLPLFHTSSKDLSLLQTQWSSILNPVVAQPFNTGNILTSVSLVNGSNTINHKLGRVLQGWVIIRKRGNANIYDTQDSNKSPSMTLTLTSDAAVVVDLLVF